jgi:hypothetical protein
MILIGRRFGPTALSRLASIVLIGLAAHPAAAAPSAEFCDFVSSLRTKSCLAKVRCADESRDAVLKEMVCSCLKGDVAPAGGQSFAPGESRLQVSCCVAGALVRNPGLCDQ